MCIPDEYLNIFLTFVWICISVSFCDLLLSCNTVFHEVVSDFLFKKPNLYLFILSFFLYCSHTVLFTSLLATCKDSKDLAVLDILYSINTPHGLLFSVFETHILFFRTPLIQIFLSYLFFFCPFLTLQNSHRPLKFFDTGFLVLVFSTLNC